MKHFLHRKEREERQKTFNNKELVETKPGRTEKVEPEERRQEDGKIKKQESRFSFHLEEHETYCNYMRPGLLRTSRERP
ncbi:hypothetical protein JWG39_07445 [Desulforhopalus vacuolatus]|uniref:hypothetical protein n=1 Tax=Desulforhopalus vacuolatus TaxID=40414 RepID=UPI00196478B8|nr:hypothetical protein [Desulforhopalus vacuolatus]MBM9519654.1 hypothetical protein [Desulforhopalus vacuolatus]